MQFETLIRSLQDNSYYYDDTIAEIEDLVLTWYRDGHLKQEIQDAMKVMCEALQSYFPFVGTIYRGVNLQTTSSYQLTDKLESFTDLPEIGVWFTSTIEDYAVTPFNYTDNGTAHLIICNTTKGFVLSDLAMLIINNTPNLELAGSLEEFTNENEILVNLSQESDYTIVRLTVDNVDNYHSLL